MTDVKYDAKLCERLIEWARTLAGVPGPGDGGLGDGVRRQLRAMADQLAAARAEIDRHRLAAEHWHAEVIKVGEMHNALGNQYLDIEAERDSMRPVVEAAERYRDNGAAYAGICPAVDAYRAALDKAGG